jgi:hypothetical protein
MRRRRAIASLSLGILLPLSISACGLFTRSSTPASPQVTTGGETTGGGVTQGGSTAGGGSTTDGSSPDGGSTTDGNSPDGGSTPEGGSTPDGGSTDGGPTTDGGNPDNTDPAGPDFSLYSLPECYVTPGGSPTGADSFGIFVALRNGGPGSWNDNVPFTMTSDTGLHLAQDAPVSPGSEFSTMQVDVGPAVYSRELRFTITADPANAIRERDESNNTLVVVVSMPPRPTSTTDVPCRVAG